MKKYHLIFYALFCLGIGTAEAQYNVLLNFNDTNGAGPVSGSLILSGDLLYGMTQGGGVNKIGCVFSININGSGYKDLLDFNGTNGSTPSGSLILSGSTLYGMATAGGANNDGCIFSIDTNGGGYADLFDYNAINGLQPLGSLTLSGNKLFGMTSEGGGGPNYYGNVFSINTNGSGFKDLLDFNKTNGEKPYGSLILSGNLLYGMTYYGGANNLGCIFVIDTTGSGYKDLLDFSATIGFHPTGDLLLLGRKLYGMTPDGGTNLDGCIFTLDTNGNGYVELVDFNGTNGSAPYGSLTYSGNSLYSMTQQGGVHNLGCVFSIDTNGSGYKDLFDFNGTNGREPTSSLTVSGNALYGMTEFGGIGGNGSCNFGCGVVFSMNDINLRTREINAASGVINLYPNPNNGKFTLALENLHEAVRIVIYNVIGEEICRAKINSDKTEITLSSQPEGIYFYRVLKETGELVGNGKLIIEK